MAAMMGVHRTTIFRMEKRGELPPRKQFNKRLIGWTEKDIQEWLESRDRDISENELEAAK